MKNKVINKTLGDEIWDHLNKKVLSNNNWILYRKVKIEEVYTNINNEVNRPTRLIIDSK